MNLPLKSVSFDWLTNSDLPKKIYRGEKHFQWLPYPLSEDIGSGGTEAWTLFTDMVIARGSISFNEQMRGQAFSFAEINIQFSEKTLQINSFIRGKAIFNDIPSGKSYVYHRGNDVYRFSENSKFIHTFDCSEDIEMVSLMIGQSVLEKLMGENETNCLLKNLNLLDSELPQVRITPSHINSPLHNALDRSLQPHLKCCLAQAKSLEFLTNLSLSNQGNHSEIKRNYDKKNIHRLHKYLKESVGQFPTLIELSAEFGKSAQVLNEAFIAEYDCSIYAFLQEQRMQQAHEAILKSDIALKQLSERMGYNHVSNFSAAFKRRFGYAPGSLRQSNKI